MIAREYGALPGGEVGGYGWLEDQSCHYRSVGISAYHPVLSGQSDTVSSINVDGYFTDWPDDATVLLSRTKNAMPAMLMYEHRQGVVIASTVYDDWAAGHSAAASDGKHLIRDIIAWAKYPDEPIADCAPGDEILLPIEVTNNTNSSATSVIFKLIDPDKTVVDTITQTESIDPAVTRSFNVTYTPLTQGIWYVDYSLEDDDGKIIQNSYEVGRFAVSNYQQNPEGYTYQGADITYAISSAEEYYAYGADAVFDVTIWNHSDDDKLITCWYCLPHNGWETDDYDT